MKRIPSKKIFFLLPLLLFVILIVVLKYVLSSSTFREELQMDNDYSLLEYLEYPSASGTIDVVYSNKKDGEVVVYFHGNTGRVNYILDYLNANHSFIAMAYPGYHQSQGKPNVDDTLQAIEGFSKVVVEVFGEQARLYVLGHSLGSQTGSYFVSQIKQEFPTLRIESLAIVGGFHSIKSECKKVLGWAGILCFIANDSFDASSYLESIREVRIFLFHLPEDPVVSYDSGQELFQSLSTPQKNFFDLTDGTHGEFNLKWVMAQLRQE